MKNNVYQKVNINDIIYVKSEDNYCRFTFKDDTSFLLRIKISYVENLLKDRIFIRCHRQYVVNQSKIKSIDLHMKTLEVGKNKIPFSQSKKQRLMTIGLFFK